jgi:hypothetical protein
MYTKNKLGLNKFDFEGSMLSSVEPVRRDFGAKQYPYFIISNYSSKWFKILFLLKNMLLKKNQM